jgi:hypothetical protein
MTSVAALDFTPPKLNGAQKTGGRDKNCPAIFADARQELPQRQAESADVLRRAAEAPA